MFFNNEKRRSKSKKTSIEIQQVGGRLSTLSCIKIVLLFLVINVIFGIALFGNHETNFNIRQFYSSFDKTVFEIFAGKTNPRNKTILIWNSAHRIETAVFGFGYEPFLKHGCDVSDCIVYDNATSSKLLPLEDYDAIIIHMHELWLTHLPEFQRKPHQRFIFLTQESPTTMPIDITILGNHFNWTMSYRLNSDVQLLYGRVLPGSTAPKTPEETQKMIEETHLPSAKNYATNKTRPIGWMVSHCDTNSLRETYARQLGKFIPVDVYGGCGNLTGSYDILLQSNYYKFYLSFENSICPDYVTETFFKTMDRNVVPIVYGGADYTQYAPIHSYIDAGQFRPEELASYLKILDANDTLYGEYFWWKDHYRVMYSADNMWRDSYCDLCQKLHRDFESKSYQDLISHWSDNNQCT